MKKFFIALALCLAQVAQGQTFVTPLDHGQLTTDLNANGKSINSVLHLTLATGGNVTNAAGTAGLDATGLFGDGSRLIHLDLSGITKNSIGLGNVPNVDATNAVNISAGTLSTDRLPVTVVRDYVTEAVSAVNQDIQGKTASPATMAIFSAANDTTHVYTRNTALWCADLDFTCISASTSVGWRITMITARHGLTAHHIGMPTGTIGYWVDKNNVTYTRTVTAVTNIVNDMDLVTLDSDLPATIQPAPILPEAVPAGYVTGTGSLLGCPIITHNQNQHLCISTLIQLQAKVAVQGVFLSVNSVSMPTAGPYALWNRAVDTPGATTPAINGDSSSPYLVVIGNQSVLIGCTFETYGGSPDPGSYVTALRTAIGNGYALNVVAMPGYPMPPAGPTGPTGATGPAGPTGPTGPAGTGSGGNGATTYDVLDNYAKFSIPNLQAGDRVVITGEANRLEEYSPIPADGHPNILVQGAGDDTVNGIYIYYALYDVYSRAPDYNYSNSPIGYDSSDRQGFILPAIIHNSSQYPSSTWVLVSSINNDDYGGAGGITPDLATWTTLHPGNGTGSPPTVSLIPNDDANWKIVGNNTVHLRVITDIETFVNGTDCPVSVDGSSTDVGWVDPAHIPMTYYGAAGFVTQIYAEFPEDGDSTGGEGQCLYQGSFSLIGPVGMLPCVCPARADPVTINISQTAP